MKLHTFAELVSGPEETHSLVRLVTPVANSATTAHVVSLKNMRSMRNCLLKSWTHESFLNNWERRLCLVDVLHMALRAGIGETSIPHKGNIKCVCALC